MSDRADDLIAGSRRALAQAITLIESTRDDHRRAAEALIERILPASGRSIRVGLSGVPGVGKSTFIEAFGLYLTGFGHKVAVLAVDPSSRRTGGSILGDKTRMPVLSRHPAAFIRPSPSSGTLGGVARRTRETILVCEAAGFDVILVETVGVGQSETAVADMVDIFCLMLLPSAGDELQGIKKGIVELAELIIVNKADGEMRAAATRAIADYRGALRLLRPVSAFWTTEILAVSSIVPEGIEAVWAAIGRHRTALQAVDEISRRRSRQSVAALWDDLGNGLIDALKHEDGIARILPDIEAQIGAGTLTPASGVRQILDLFLGNRHRQTL